MDAPNQSNVGTKRPRKKAAVKAAPPVKPDFGALTVNLLPLGNPTSFAAYDAIVIPVGGAGNTGQFFEHLTMAMPEWARDTAARIESMAKTFKSIGAGAAYVVETGPRPPMAIIANALPDKTTEFTIAIPSAVMSALDLAESRRQKKIWG